MCASRLVPALQLARVLEQIGGQPSKHSKTQPKRKDSHRTQPPREEKRKHKSSEQHRNGWERSSKELKEEDSKKKSKSKSGLAALFTGRK